MRKTTRICNWLDDRCLNAPTPEAARQDATFICAICRLSYCSVLSIVVLLPEHEEPKPPISDLDALRARRDKTHARKQSMMQEFFAYGTRLVRRPCGPVTPHSSLKSASQP